MVDYASGGASLAAQDALASDVATAQAAKPAGGGGLWGILGEVPSLVGNAPIGLAHFLGSAFTDPAAGAIIGGALGTAIGGPGFGTGVGAAIGGGVGGAGDVAKHAYDPHSSWSPTGESFVQTGENLASLRHGLAGSNYGLAYNNGHLLGAILGDVGNAAILTEGLGKVLDAAPALSAAKAADAAATDAEAQAHALTQQLNAVHEAAANAPGPAPELGAQLRTLEPQVAQATADATAKRALADQAAAAAEHTKTTIDRYHAVTRLAQQGAYAPLAPWEFAKKLLVGDARTGATGALGKIADFAESHPNVPGAEPVSQLKGWLGAQKDRYVAKAIKVAVGDHLDRLRGQITDASLNAAKAAAKMDAGIHDPVSQVAADLVVHGVSPAYASVLNLLADKRPDAIKPLVEHLADRAGVAPEEFQRALDFYNPKVTDPAVQEMRAGMAQYAQGASELTALHQNAFRAGIGDPRAQGLDDTERQMYDAEVERQIHGTTPHPQAAADVQRRFFNQRDRLLQRQDRAIKRVEDLLRRRGDTSSAADKIRAANESALATAHELLVHEDPENARAVANWLASSQDATIRRVAEHVTSGGELNADVVKTLADRMIVLARRAHVTDPVAAELVNLFTDSHGGPLTVPADVVTGGKVYADAYNQARLLGQGDLAARLAGDEATRAARQTILDGVAERTLPEGTPQAMRDAYAAALDTLDQARQHRAELTAAGTEATPAGIRAARDAIHAERRAVADALIAERDALGVKGLPQPPAESGSARRGGAKSLRANADSYDRIRDQLGPRAFRSLSDQRAGGGEVGIDSWAAEVGPMLVQRGLLSPTAVDDLESVVNGYIDAMQHDRILASAIHGAIKNGVDWRDAPATLAPVRDEVYGGTWPEALTGSLADAAQRQATADATAAAMPRLSGPTVGEAAAGQAGRIAGRADVLANATARANEAAAAVPLDAGGNLISTIASRVAPIERARGRIDQQVLDATARVNLTDRQLAGLNAREQVELAKAAADINNAPSRYRESLTFAKETNHYLAELAGTLNGIVPGSGDIFNQAAPEVTFTLADMVRHQPDWKPEYRTGIKVGDLTPGGRGAPATPETRVPGSIRQKRDITAERLPSRQAAAVVSDLRTRLRNQAAYDLADTYGRNLADIIPGARVLTYDDARLALDQARARGYVPWDMTGYRQNATLGPNDLFTRLAKDPESVRWVPEPMVREYRRYVRDEYLGGRLETLLQQYVDTPTRWWKTAVLALRPAWHVGVMTGHAIMAMVGGGIDPVTFARDVRIANGLLRGVAPRDLIERFGMTDRQVAGLDAQGAVPGLLVRRGLLASDVGPEREPSLETTGPPSAHGPEGILSGHPIKWSYAMNGFTTDVQRLAVYLAKLDKGFSQREIGYYRDRFPAMKGSEATTPFAVQREMALKEALRVGGDFSKMTAFERYVVRRAFPFYSWLRHITRLSLDLAAHHPLRVAWMMKLGSMANENGDIPLLYGAFPVGAGWFLKLPNVNPFRDVPTVFGINEGAGGAPPSAQGLLGSLNPLYDVVAGATGAPLPSQGEYVPESPSAGATDAYGRPTGKALAFSPREFANFLASQVPESQIVQDLPALWGHNPVLRYPTGQPIQVQHQDLPLYPYGYAPGHPFPERAPELGPLASLLGLPRFEQVDTAGIRLRAAARRARG